MSEKESFVLRQVPTYEFICIYFYLNVYIFIAQFCTSLNGSRHHYT